MKRRLILFIFLVSCTVMTSDSNVLLTLEKDNLIIENRTSENLYFIILDDVSIAYTDWRPFIKPFSSFVKPDSKLSETFDRSKNSSKLILYYWFKSDDTDGDDVANQTQSIELKLDP